MEFPHWPDATQESGNGIGRYPCGYAPFDALLGGLVPGETIGLLGPLKGGKTTLAYSLISELIRQSSPGGGSRRATFVTYEDSFRAQWPRLLVSYLRDVDRDQLEGRSPAEMAPELQARLRAAQDELYRALTFVDCSGRRAGRGGVLELEATLRDLRSRGELGDLVIVDHAFALVLRYASGDVANLMRPELVRLCQCFPELMQEFGTVGLLIHQLNAPGNRLRPSQRPAFTDAAEHHHFAQFLHHCLGLGVRDENDVAWLSIACSRPCPRDKAVAVRLVGQRCRVELVEDGEFDPRLGRFTGKGLPQPESQPGSRRPTPMDGNAGSDWHADRFERRRGGFDSAPTIRYDAG